MENFVCDFYIAENLHRLEVLASPWKSEQEIYVDNTLIVKNKGKLVNHCMFYSIEVENMPITVSIRDCGLCCEFNAYLDNTSFVDGSRLDTRKIVAERIVDAGYVEYLKSRLTSYISKGWVFLLLFIFLHSVFAGFSLLSISCALLAFAASLPVSALKDFHIEKQIVNKWFNQYQQVEYRR